MGTGRVLGDVGQATFVGSPGQTVASRPDHVIKSSKVYGAAQSARVIAPMQHISDHCTMSLVFRVDDVSFNADGHCKLRMCVALGDVVAILY